ncbi:MAG: hypothetical protein KAS21_02610 [Candidatus Aminicenantes bacterium]|nr:hypothetical protein [Candidatus Aminicenantes bacterium]
MKGKLRVNPKIRRWILVSGPFVFSIFSSLVYILIFSPVNGTPDFTNIIFVFFASIGWSAHILYGNREMFRASYYLSAISIGFPFLILEVFRLYPYNVYQGRITLGLIIAANLWLIVIYKNLRLKALNPAEENQIN